MYTCLLFKWQRCLPRFLTIWQQCGCGASKEARGRRKKGRGGMRPSIITDLQNYTPPRPLSVASRVPSHYNP